MVRKELLGYVNHYVGNYMSTYRKRDRILNKKLYLAIIKIKFDLPMLAVNSDA